MARFIGTEKDFFKYVGNYTKDLIPKLTEEYKNKIGECQHCGAKEIEFSYTHKKNMQPRVLKEHILKDYYTKESDIVDVNLVEFTERYSMLYDAPHLYGYVLCSKCSKDYKKNIINDQDMKL